MRMCRRRLLCWLVTKVLWSPVISWTLFAMSLVYIICVNTSSSYVLGKSTSTHGLTYIVVLEEGMDVPQNVPDVGSVAAGLSQLNPVAGQPWYSLGALGATLWTAPGPAAGLHARASVQQLYADFKKPSLRCRKLVNMGGQGCTRRYEGNKDVSNNLLM
ncbi:uncharacterized protein LOC125177959 [Hyalella azteca]|uniref:Uncharacterized protein LOC125177959 n=1 Tax=Hyalella azteca TaxID=294128 RepID=A0A979FKA8_HYAAZ|nr:uncharacterized protein LOC125177959 [Hyalella azteca]